MVCVPLQEVSIVCVIQYHLLHRRLTNESSSGGHNFITGSMLVCGKIQCSHSHYLHSHLQRIHSHLSYPFRLLIYLYLLLRPHFNVAAPFVIYQMQLHRYVCHPILPVNDIIMLSLSMYVIARTDPILSSSESMNANHSMK